ncbi:MAG: glycosyltransferase [Lysobacterales bacterium]
MTAPARRWTVLQVLPALQAGGAERSTLEIGRALVAAGHRSVVLSAGGRLEAQLLAEGSEHHRLPIANKSLRSLAQISAIRRLLQTLDPDLLHLRSRLPAWLCWLARPPKRSPRPRWVSTVHGLNSVNAYSAILLRAERIICVSQTSADYLKQHYADCPVERLRVIRRGVDPMEFSADAKRTDPSWRARLQARYPALSGRYLLLLPGRGTRLKGHDSALQLLARLRAEGVDASLLLLGADQAGRERYLRHLHELASQLNLSGHWQALPMQADVADYYRHADLVLQLSTRPESFGRTVAEALLLGRPVLGWDLGGVGEQLRDAFPSGLVPLGDEGSLLRRASALLADPQIETIDRGRLTTVDRMQQQTLAVYAELLGTPATSR